ncbi:FtsX-like permease family protein [Kineococcus rhizosphaerae]|uniref:FtsX-like permease family protein n=1 Tax=Kineococcus rhizosphaerae TaxID=559628 RepID=UPI001475E5AB|nr:FtsX-like permease family protein [Kineococcus rhizosphaerae]
MRTAVRSLRVNRSGFLGAAGIVALAATLLGATAAWGQAAVRSDDLPLLLAATGSFGGTLLLVVVLVVSGVLSGALRERRREFALLRAVGATGRQVRAAIRAEVLVLVLAVVPPGALAGTALAPRATSLLVAVGAVPAGWRLDPSLVPLLVTVLLLVPTGWVVAALAGREVTRPSPTAAVRDSTADLAPVARARTWTAAALAATGLAAAGTPAASSGTTATATAASSALLLVVAAALAGPLLVRWAAGRAVGRIGGRGAATTLALLNLRGSARRVSAAVVPLALLVSLGVVQSGTNQAVVRAAGDQVRAGLRADLVATADGLTTPDIRSVAAVAGVSGVTVSGSLPASVRVDLDDDDLGGRLSWEAATVRTLGADRSGLDLAVSSGSLRDLDRPATIAVGRDAVEFTGVGVGDPVEVRIDSGRVERRTVVAVYERGLGFGDYAIGSPPTAGPVQFLVRLAPGADRRAGERALTAMGLQVSDREGFVAAAVDDARDSARFSLGLLVALLAFIAAAAATTLRRQTVQRRGEFALLSRTGASAGQLRRVLAVEAAVTAAVAVVVGIVAVLPALTGVGYALTGVPLPAVDVPVSTGVVAAAVLVVAAGVLPAGFRVSSRTRGSSFR